MGEPELEGGRRALASGDWAAARGAYERVLAESEAGGVLEGLGRACYGLRDYPAATSAFEKAFARYREEGNDPRAAFVAARWLAWLYGAVHGNEAAAGGWFARAQRLLEDAEPAVEAGWVGLMEAALASEHGFREQRAQEALAVARTFGDKDLEFCALAYVGECLVVTGHVDEGMVLLDEALAACSGGEVRDFVAVGEIFCKLFAACEQSLDIARAEQWLEVVDDLWRRQNLIGFTAICRTHYGGILTAAGRWAEAERELRAAVDGFDHTYRALRTNPLVRLAHLHVRQGRLEEAAQLLAGLDRHPDAPQALASLYLARGETVLAQDVLERTLAASGRDEITSIPLLALLVEAQLARGAVENAAVVSDRLTSLAESCGSNYGRAVAALCRGRIGIATGSGDARFFLEQALAALASAPMPFEHAQARLELARAMADERREVAIEEAGAALASFEALDAKREADAAAALLRSLGAPARTGPKGRGSLTKREAEVLVLLGHGLSNQQIAERLYISPRTAEHHVGRILTKLGLRRRAEATAFAARSAEPS